MLIMTNIKKRLTCCWYIDSELRDIVEFELFVSSQLLLLVELVATILCSANSILRQNAVRQYLDSYKVIYPKWYKHLAYALATTLDYECLAYFEPEKYAVKPKLTIFSTF